jgi:Na+/melibiose symporter-like transporter
VRQEGVFYAVEAFSVKAVSGIGALIGGFILDLVKFPNGVDPGTVPDDVLFWLGVFAGPVLAVVWFIPLGLTFLLDMDRKRHAEIKAALAQRSEE